MSFAPKSHDSATTAFNASFAHLSMDAIALSNLFDSPCSVSCGTASGKFAAGWHLLPLTPSETPAAYAQWAKKRQREFQAGRHHAKTALRSAGHLGDCSIRRDPNGVPLFPQGYSGSITHTGKSQTFAAAVVAHELCAVGLDIESHRCLDDELFDHILSTEEARALFDSNASGLPQKEGERCLLAFSAKEAFYKCVYPRVRTFFGFRDVRFDVLSPGHFSVRPRDNMFSGLPVCFGGRYLVSEDFVAAGVTWTPNLVRDSTTATL